MSHPDGRAPREITRYALAVLWLLGAALAYLAPALSRGASLGDYELLSVFGFGRTPGATVHNAVSSDQIQEMIPWTNLSWLQVHHGHLPLWNPFAALGLPLAFNFQSASFSLSTAVSYLFPLHLAYTATVVVKLLVGGTGVMFLCRVLGIRLVPATLAGTVFELSGAFTAWSGWPQDGVYCWLGWILGAVILVVRSRRPVPFTVLLAVFVALTVLGGHPESITITLVCGAVFAAVSLFEWRGAAGPGRALVERALLLVAGLAAGLGLAAPLLLPGAQVVTMSSHTASHGYLALTHSNSANLAFSTFYGLPVLHQTYFGSRNYYSAASYVGIGALCLAVVALVCDRRRRGIWALSGLGLVCAAILYSTTVAGWLSAIPGLDLILWDRVVIPLGLVLAVLAGAGLQVVSERGRERRVVVTTATAAGLSALLIAVLAAYTAWSGTPRAAAARHERLDSLAVPGFAAAAGLVAAGALLFALRRSRLRPRRSDPWLQRIAATLIGGAEIVFLLTATPQLWSSSARGFAPTPAERAYEAAVGSARVGFAVCPSVDHQPDLGILAEANSAYGVSELAAYDPVVPKDLYRSWAAATGSKPVLAINNFCAGVGTVALAREFGVTYILVPDGMQAPAGTVETAHIQSVGVWHVPGSGIVTETAASAPPGAAGTAVPYGSSSPSTLRMRVQAPRPEALRLHISDYPGWHATVDGRSVPVHRWAGAMMSIPLPAGNHTVQLTYRPAAWTAGLVIMLLSAVVLLGALTAPAWLRRFGRPASRDARSPSSAKGSIDRGRPAGGAEDHESADCHDSDRRYRKSTGRPSVLRRGAVEP